MHQWCFSGSGKNHSVDHWAVLPHMDQACIYSIEECQGSHIIINWVNCLSDRNIIIIYQLLQEIWSKKVFFFSPEATNDSPIHLSSVRSIISIVWDCGLFILIWYDDLFFVQIPSLSYFLQKCVSRLKAMPVFMHNTICCNINICLHAVA